MVTEKLLLSNRPAMAWVDLAVFGVLVAFIYAVVTLAREWTGPLQAVAEIHTEARYLPLYAFFSLARGVFAYGVSFVFTMVYGYAMARMAGAEPVLLPLLDILQSIPVLGFLPGFVLGLVHLFPHQNLGLELASILMIFTGQAWNMTFSFYASLKSVPPDLVSVARVARLSWWTRFRRLELSHAATGLVWNSMMSMAGGWFFLTVSEAFVLGDHDFRLPGLGSYMSLAIERGDGRAQLYGVLAMLLMIVLVDQVVWRPVVAWSQKFTDEASGEASESWVWAQVRRSRIWGWITRAIAEAGRRARPWGAPASIRDRPNPSESGTWIRRLMLVAVGSLAIYGLVGYGRLLTAVSPEDWRRLVAGVAVTFLRVGLAVALGTIWTVPVGVLIGRRPRWSRRLQPIIQMAASFPAPMIFPLVVGVLLRLGVGLEVSSVVLLLMGTQWYILFNVMAGASSIPRDFWEVSKLGRFTFGQRWRALILPGLFPSLVTGWISATGGAWNASIVAEYLKYDGRTLSATGLGSTISRATEHGNFPLLAAAVGLMALVVVGFNRLVWRSLSHQAQTRFALNT